MSFWDTLPPPKYKEDADRLSALPIFGVIGVFVLVSILWM